VGESDCFAHEECQWYPGLFYSLVEDISRRKAAEAELAQAKLDAERAAQAKSDFVAHIAHEIRTPLNTIISLSHLLNKRDIEPKMQQRFLKTLQDSGDALLELVNNILDLERIEADMLAVDCEKIPVRTLLDSCVNIMSVKAMEKKLSLDLICSLGASTVIRTDAVKFRQIIMNLLANAIKFTQKGAVVLEASKIDCDGKEFLTFAVRDTGIGISPDRLQSIFEKFTQEDTTTCNRFGGTGLGLTISRKLARLLGGDLAVESNVDIGSVFTLTLPAEIEPALQQP
jgi:signal transduction histidine kinase